MNDEDVRGLNTHLSTEDWQALGFESTKALGENYPSNKYNAIRVLVKREDGSVLKFDSRKEQRRWVELSIMQQAGQISELEIHKRFLVHDGYELDGRKERPITYICDFYYKDSEGRQVVEDVKGGKATQTALFKVKKKLFEARYRIPITIIEE